MKIGYRWYANKKILERKGDNHIEKALLNLKEVSEYLGLGETKTRELLKSRNCPFSMKIGYRWYANKKILDKWIQEQSEKKGGNNFI